MSQSFQVVTCMGRIAKEPYYILEQWSASLARYGVKPTVLGQPPYAWPWGGLVSKVKFLKRAIDEKIITEKVVVFADCFDLVYAAPPRELVDKFVSMGVPIVCGAEKDFFVAHNNIQMAAMHPPSPSSFKYTNTGFLIGYTEAFDEALDEMEVDFLRDDYRLPGGGMIENNDQNAWCRQLLFGKVRMGLDHTAALVANCHGVKLDDLEFLPNQKIRLKETGTTPMVIHFNGNKEPETKAPILKHLGLM